MAHMLRPPTSIDTFSIERRATILGVFVGGCLHQLSKTAERRCKWRDSGIDLFQSAKNLGYFFKWLEWFNQII